MYYIIISLFDMLISRKTVILFYGFFIIINHTLSGQDISNIQLANQYFQQGDNNKALMIYEKLANNTKNIPLIHDNYFQLMLMTGRFDQAETYIEKAIQKFSSNINYKIDRGLIYVQKNEKDQADIYYRKLINQFAEDPFRVRIAAQHFAKNQLLEYAIELYKLGRKNIHDPTAYSIQMASLYRLLNDKRGMIEEYLNYTNQNANNLRSIKNILQNVLTDDEDLGLLESLMYEKVQREPNNSIYNDLLIWVNVQRKNFYAAFIQARALDKRMKLKGVKVMEIGQISMINKDYKNALKIFDYVFKTYPGTPNYQIARRLVIRCREEIVKNNYPVDEGEIRALIKDYRNLVTILGINQNTVEALRSEAKLYAFYLHSYDSAINILNEIISLPRINSDIVNKSKLDLGDIYLLIDEPWESTLLYAQVEKLNKETPIGYEAKLRNARLSYYQGDFALAQSHLDILKMATTREIANDAMALSMLIKDNNLGDSTSSALKRYSEIDLLIFQNKKHEALQALKKLISDFPDHPIVDEALYKEATLNIEMGKFTVAIEKLQIIIDKYDQDILGDDALFLQGKIYQDYLSESEKAKEIYRTFLVKYPGSNLAAEARKRFRILRGDFLQ